MHHPVNGRPRRGSRTVNSVKSPTSLSTVMRAAVLLRYDLVADRQPKPGALAGRLGREERLEQLIPVFRRNADAIVAHPDLNAFAELAGRDLQCRAESAVALAAHACWRHRSHCL